MSHVLDPFECDCECHEDGVTMHMVACCEECEICGTRIQSGHLVDHVRIKHAKAPKVPLLGFKELDAPTATKASRPPNCS